MYKDAVEGTVYKRYYDSVSELAAETERDPKLSDSSYDEEFIGCAGPVEAYKLARDGWTAHLDETLNVAEQAVSKVETETEFPTFVPEFDVTGADVDVARFLSGEPENMISYPLRPIVRAGRVITLCVSISYSGAVEAETIMRRGQAAAALALALSKLGYSSEIWADFSCSEKMSGDRGKIVSNRCLIKGPQDALDPERIAYALAHPSMLRVLGFSAARHAPKPFVDAIGTHTLGYPINPVEDMPEGTLYTPCVLSDKDVPDADKQLIAWLKQLEIIPDED